MRAIGLVVLLAVGVMAMLPPSERFEGHQVLRLSIPDQLTTDQHAAYFNLRSQWNLDWWSDSDVRVEPERLADVKRFLDEHSLSFSVMIEDVQTLVNAEAANTQAIRAQEQSNRISAPLMTSGNLTAPDFFKDYRALADIWTFVDGLIQQYSSLATKKQIGTSYEGRPLYVVVISSGKAGANIYLEGGIHSREWVAHTTVLFVMWNLLSQYGTNPNITKIVDSYNFHINPAVNPDGYIWTWTRDRMWRKTRSPNKGSSCIGVDPNRNWNNHWCEQGASRDPCSDSYCGPSAFSEKEVKAVADYTQGLTNVKSFIDFHSYSQLWMQPYGWTAARPAKYDDQRRAGLDAVAAIKRTHQKTYQEGSIYTIIYPASGSSADWAYDTCHVGYPYGVELRDTGQYGFLLPANQIVPTGEEILAGLQAMIAYIDQHP